MSQQSTVDIPDNENYFPFHALIAYVYDSEFETLGSTRTRLLSQLRFNPFQTNQNIALSGSNIDLDTCFNTNNICCDYFLPTDFKTRIETKNIQGKFSLMHLISKLYCKYTS